MDSGGVMPDDRPQIDLLASVQRLPRVDGEQVNLLAKLGIRCLRDLLFHFPRDYQHWGTPSSLDDLEEGERIQLVGTIDEINARQLSNGRHMIGALIRNGNDHLRAIWFNQPYLMRQLERGEQVRLVGKVKKSGLRFEMHQPRVTAHREGDAIEAGLQSVYRVTQGLTQHQMRSWMRWLVERAADSVEEVFPADLLQRFAILPIGQALRAIHLPPDESTAQAARYRFVYQELLTMQLALAWRAARTASSASLHLPCDARVAGRIERLLPFALTPGQRVVINEIVSDLQMARPMNRLLQGDVGSGKTIVAAYAMLVAVAAGTQAALMAPTEVLASQHYDTLRRLLRSSQVRLAMLTGNTAASERKQLEQQLAAGEIDILIGTQAIAGRKKKAESSLGFAKLSLVVIDEQHKFGVRQRAFFRQTTDIEPHRLVMTATPIPRTVAMTLFGDLDVSVMRGRPPGRQPVNTYIGSDEQRPRWWQFVRKKLSEGRQAYVIAPQVDRQDESVQAAEQLFERLVSDEFEAYRVDLLHGRMNSSDKQAAMEKFRDGSTQILVATSLVEVGIDVPNANVMTIENAERFGLAQLHQLRGRIGRGAHPGFLCLFSPHDSLQTRQRLEILANTADGFELAEKDFELRGPGDLFGTQQHGLPPLRIANLQQDQAIVSKARQDARWLLELDPMLEAPQHQSLLRRVTRRYGTSLDLSDIG